MTALVRFARRAGIAAALAVATPLVGLAAGLVGAEQAVAQSTSSIIVQGNRRIEADTIRSYFRSGSTDAASVDEALKALFATGLFADVRITQQGGRLVVTVQENPIINRVAFEGNQAVRDNVLEVEVESKPRGTLSRARVQNDVQRIIDIYRRQGRSNATVEPKIIELPESRVDLVFEINEGAKVGVRSIDFVGNQAFSDGRLNDVITTSETGILSFLQTTDVYDPDRLDADQELLRRFYLRNGYADFRVVSATADVDPSGNGGYSIVITVEEGPQYRFGAVTVESSIPDVNADRLQGVVRTKSGEVYNAELVEKSLEEITLEVSRSGYAFAQVRPRGSRNPATNTIDITYVVEEGPRVYVERINIRGNTRTQDEVIRREFSIAEGDAYNRVLVDRAERRLNSLRYFKTVKVTNEPGSAPDRVIINVLLEEEATGNVSLGGGYSTNDGFIADVSLTERNFLGRGQQLRVAVALGERRTGGEVSFTEPYFLGQRLSLGFDAFYREVDLQRTSSYDYTLVGGAVRFGLPITDEVGLSLRYRLSDYEISEVDDSDPNRRASPIIQFYEDENYLTSALSYSLVYDTLDNRRSPRNGFLFTFGQEGAGLGGDVTYLKTTGEGRYYREIFSDFVGLIKFEGGYISDLGQDELRVFDTFFKGGETVRGFDTSGFGPRFVGESFRDDALGGTTYAAATAEVTFPFPFISRDFGLRGAVFADAGTLFDASEDAERILAECRANPARFGAATCNGEIEDDASIRSAVGVGILWQSPFGPLRADFALPVTKEDYDDEQFFRFSGGTSF